MAGSVEEARLYLGSLAIPQSVISPQDFAMAASETGKSFDELVLFLAGLMQGGQGLGPSPVTQAIAEGRSIA